MPARPVASAAPYSCGSRRVDLQKRPECEYREYQRRHYPRGPKADLGPLLGDLRSADDVRTLGLELAPDRTHENICVSGDLSSVRTGQITGLDGVPM